MSLTERCFAGLQWLICTLVYHIPWVRTNLLLGREPSVNLYSVRALRSLLHTYQLDRHKKVTQGSPAIDAQVWTLDGVTCKLLDFARVNRPLVLNFGSCS